MSLTAVFSAQVHHHRRLQAAQLLAHSLQVHQQRSHAAAHPADAAEPAPPGGTPQTGTPCSQGGFAAPQPPLTSSKCSYIHQNNTAKLVKQLSKSAENEGGLDSDGNILLSSFLLVDFEQEFSSGVSDLRTLASELVDGWMAIIRSQSVSNSSPAGTGCLLPCSHQQPPNCCCPS